jgi:hypothetical protein
MSQGAEGVAVHVKWVMNVCHLGNTAMPEEELALLACPRGYGDWVVAFKSRKVRALLEPCFSGCIVEELPPNHLQDSVLVVKLSEPDLEWECDPEVFLSRLAEYNIKAVVPDRAVWLDYITV